MKIISISGLPGSGRTTCVNAMAAALLNTGFTPIVEKFDDSIAQRALRHFQGEARDLLDSDGPWYERVIILDNVTTLEELARVRSAGGKSVFISAMNRIAYSVDLSVPYQYEMGELEDTLFDFTISNNDADGQTLFETVAGGLARSLVSDAREECK